MFSMDPHSDQQDGFCRVGAVFISSEEVEM